MDLIFPGMTYPENHPYNPLLPFFICQIVNCHILSHYSTDLTRIRKDFKKKNWMFHWTQVHHKGLNHFFSFYSFLPSSKSIELDILHLRIFYLTLILNSAVSINNGLERIDQLLQYSALPLHSENKNTFKFHCRLCSDFRATDLWVW